MKNVYFDEVSGEELESYVIRDRERLAQEGVLILMVEINASTCQLARKPDIMRGTALPESQRRVDEILTQGHSKSAFQSKRQCHKPGIHQENNR